MPKASPARLDAENYRFSVEIATRFGDLDQVGHVNNVSIANLFQEARFRFDRAYDCKPRIEGVNAVLVSITIDFIGETFHPAPVDIHCGIGRLGDRSWEIHQLATQAGRPVALCTATMVCFAEGRALPIPARWCEGLSAVLMKDVQPDPD